MNFQHPEDYIKGVLDCNRLAIAKTITLIESSLPKNQELSRTILEELLPHTGKAIRLGITGVPGVGKSTYVESLGSYLVDNNNKVAVLAVDPSSRRSGGSILGDKTRMERLATLENAFIRPSPSGGTLGGVAKKTRETMLVCEAAGYEIIIVETVGVGQSETTVSSMVDFFMVLMLAGAGDELQGIKKGILEIADAIVINKSDGDNIDKADRARKEYEKALHFVKPASIHWFPPVNTCSALKNRGVEETWKTVLSHNKIMTETGELKEKRRKQSLDWMWSIIEHGLIERFNHHPKVKKKIKKVTQSVENGISAPTVAADRLLLLIDK